SLSRDVKAFLCLSGYKKIPMVSSSKAGRGAVVQLVSFLLEKAACHAGGRACFQEVGSPVHSAIYS
ncbi:hypothetical protein, partial [Vibrio sp. 99-8-1]|uniref:hypothetical protein n=1 Tax=Vibrio sp. 99-8-1 TaxID=2607602 RepID=UPI001C127323